MTPARTSLLHARRWDSEAACNERCDMTGRCVAIAPTLLRDRGSSAALVRQAVRVEPLHRAVRLWIRGLGGIRKTSAGVLPSECRFVNGCCKRRYNIVTSNSIKWVQGLRGSPLLTALSQPEELLRLHRGPSKFSRPPGGTGGSGLPPVLAIGASHGGAALGRRLLADE